jgi:outer membrane lipoprotein LolB
MKIRNILIFCCLCFISHSSFAQVQPILKYFEVEGKVAFSHGREGGNAGLTWEQQGSRYAIRLFGALGSGTVEIYGRPGFVGLVESNGKTHTATNPEQLIKKVLGWDIPVSPLQYWLQGHPVPGNTPHRLKYDEYNRLVFLQQQGWTIQYQGYAMHECGLWLPSKIVLERNGIRLRFIFKYWSPRSSA